MTQCCCCIAMCVLLLAIILAGILTAIIMLGMYDRQCCLLGLKMTVYLTSNYNLLVADDENIFFRGERIYFVLSVIQKVLSMDELSLLRSFLRSHQREFPLSTDMKVDN